MANSTKMQKIFTNVTKWAVAIAILTSGAAALGLSGGTALAGNTWPGTSVTQDDPDNTWPAPPAEDPANTWPAPVALDDPANTWPAPPADDPDNTWPSA